MQGQLHREGKSKHQNPARRAKPESAVAIRARRFPRSPSPWLVHIANSCLGGGYADVRYLAAKA